MARALAIILAISISVGTSSFGQGLAGDCDGDGVVRIAELIAAVRIALNRAEVETCAAADVDGNGRVGVNELIDGVRAALGLVTPRPASETPTPTLTPRPVEIPTPSPGLDQPCEAQALEGLDDIRLPHSTSGNDAANRMGEAPCGWGGGNDSPDRGFEYEAPEAGVYDIAVKNAEFSPVLTVRRETCRNELLEQVASSGAPERACGDDANGERAAQVVVKLVRGQRIAITVDGTDPEGGAFELLIHRRKPDLVVKSVAPVPPANAGTSVVASAVIQNQGDGESGPLRVEFFYSRDGTLSGRLGNTSSACDISGLAAQESITCNATTPLAVPLVADGDVFVVAAVDSGGALAIATSLEVVGVELEQQVFRSDDGTVYQIVRAVPRAVASDVGSYTITTLAGTLGNLETCGDVGTTRGGGAETVVRAAVGTNELVGLGSVQRTGLLRPNAFGDNATRFESNGSGRLRLGANAGELEICVDPGACDTETPLFVLDETGGGVGPVCRATIAADANCGDLGQAIALGLDGGDRCTGAVLPLTATKVCNLKLSRGLLLDPGEAVVFLHRPGRESYELGVAGFGASGAHSTGRCGTGQVLSAEVHTAAIGRAPSLVPVQVRRAQGLFSPQAIAVTDSDVYLADDRQIAVYRRGQELEWIQTLSEGEDGVSGLTSGVNSVAASADGLSVYVGSGNSGSLEGAIAVFRRVEGGRLKFVEVVRHTDTGVDGLAGVTSVVASPDGENVYVTSDGDHAITVFRRVEDGRLEFVEATKDSDQGVDGLFDAKFAAVSADGDNVYVSGSRIAVFRRIEGGRLRWIEMVGGAENVSSLAVSPDGSNVYAVHERLPRQKEIVIFERLSRGGLNPVGAVPDTELGVDGRFDATSVSVSTDGRNVYVRSGRDGAIAVLARTVDGRLEFVEVETELSVSRNTTLAPSGDNVNVYVTSDTRGTISDDAVVVFVRGEDGRLDRVDQVDFQDPIDGLFGAGAVAVTPDGQYVYVVGWLDDSVAVFRRSEDGRLETVEVVKGIDLDLGTLFGFSSIVVSQDGENLYVASPLRNGIAIFGKAADGRLRFVDFIEVTDPGFEFGGDPPLVASADGNNLYLASPSASTVLVFNRIDDGLLEFLQSVKDDEDGVDGLSGARSVVLTADGENVYVLGEGDDALAIFQRVEAGRLRFVGVVKDTGPRVRGLDSATFITMGYRGEYLYAGGKFGEVAVFGRLPGGDLSFVEVAGQGDDAIGSTVSLLASADGQNVYAVGEFDHAIAVFRRVLGGRLEFVEVVSDTDPGVDGLARARAVAVSPDAMNLYVASLGDNAIAVFRRAAN